MTDLPKHLGGHSYHTHLDPGALACLIEWFSPDTAVDIGCGVGGMVQMMLAKGLSCMGVDGDWTAVRSPGLYVLHDYNTGPLHISPVDLCWSVEFLEHVDAKYLPNIFATLASCSTVFCTHALPDDRPNQYHRNLWGEVYWVQEFEDHGFRLDRTATNAVRAASTMDRHFVRETGKVFVRKNRAQDKPASG